LPSLPAKAKSKVVFPEPGGPKSKVILQKHQNMNNKIWIFIVILSKINKKLYLIHLLGFMIPLTF
jgi:hypothetical protein